MKRLCLGCAPADPDRLRPRWGIAHCDGCGGYAILSMTPEDYAAIWAALTSDGPGEKVATVEPMPWADGAERGSGKGHPRRKKW